MAQLTTAQFAGRLGVSHSRVRQMLATGVITGTAITRRLTMVDESELAKARKRSGPGRPRKAKAEKP